MKEKKPSYNIEAVSWIILLHLLCLLAPAYYRPDSLVVCLVLLFTVSPVGINMTYHRLIAHRAFVTPKWFEYILVTIGTLSGQGPVLNWVAGHRHHHLFSDQADKDLHTPNRGGFWGAHMVAILQNHPIFDKDESWQKYIPDLKKDRYYQFLSRYAIQIALLQLPLLYAAGGISYILWGGIVRVTLMLHLTWFVNSACHMWGYRNFNTNDLSTNCWWVGILAAGEGWHNNHHAQPSSASHGMRWFEIDLTYFFIRVLALLGLATHIKKPKLALLKHKKIDEEDVLAQGLSNSA